MNGTRGADLEDAARLHSQVDASPPKRSAAIFFFCRSWGSACRKQMDGWTADGLKDLPQLNLTVMPSPSKLLPKLVEKKAN